MRSWRPGRARGLAVLGLLAYGSSAATAQGAVGPPIPLGSRLENYLRYAQTLGRASEIPWSLRGFGPADADALRSAAEVGTSPRVLNGLRWTLAPTSVKTWYNTTFPFGHNDGPVWTGRGLTAAVEGGVALRWRSLSVTMQPTAFIAQNARFPLMNNGQAGALAFADGQIPQYIDRPQRFGSSAYGRVDPGQSEVRLDAFGLMLGAGTANEWWGPMQEWPFLLGTNAAGVPRIFAGTSRAVSVGIGRLSGRVFWGSLEQTPYSSAVPGKEGRFASGIIGVFTPGFSPGLELGVARVFELPWPAGGIGWYELRKPLEGFLKESVGGDPSNPDDPSFSRDNQLASVFARWVFPRSGVEVYGEYGRDDHNWNMLDAIGEPDHAASYGLGLRKAWRRGETALSGVRAEMIDMERSTLQRHRSQAFFYANAQVVQGWTQHGQVLGAGFGGGNTSGQMLAYDHMSSPEEGLTFSLTRMAVREDVTGAPPLPRRLDVQLALSGSRTRQAAGALVTYGLTAVYEMNRYFVADVGNVLATASVRW